MKISDVFELPVPPVLLDEYAPLEYMKDGATMEDADKVTARAINMHDELVDGMDSALKLLIKAFDAQRSDYDEKSISLSDLGYLHELLTRAKGEE